MPKIYVLAEGSYGDYSIVGVFSTLAAAEAVYCEEAEHVIEEYELDALVGWSYGDVWSAVYDKDTDEVTLHSVVYKQVRHPTECRIDAIRNGIAVYSPISAEHAREVAAEKRREWIMTKVSVCHP